MRHATTLLLALGMLPFVGCSSSDERPENPPAAQLHTIPPPAPSSGDAERGRSFLLYGDYIGSGFPYDLYISLLGGGAIADQPIQRDGKSGTIPITFNYFRDLHGAEIVAGVNCLGCHASRFGDDYIVGLGNSFSDWTGDDPFPTMALMLAAGGMYPDAQSPERVSLQRFLRGVQALEGDPPLPFKGINPAFRIEELAASWRDPRSLVWQDERVFDVPVRPIATDVPPWWHVKKKHGLYYNGMGRGDFAKLIQQITVVGIEDDQAAERIHGGMTHLLAYLRTIEAPRYPRNIDRALAREGRAIFENTCMGCHGGYGAGFGDPDWTYPNRLVPVEVVGTDPVYARTLMTSGLPRWYNESWFAITEPRSRVEPTMAYIAPPLDGIWVSAPYLHNGSVPTLEALLDSSKRPARWRRSFDPKDYDFVRVGWRYQAVPEGARAGKDVYDTTIHSYGNQGHTFGDDLSDEERWALIEYLKTL